MRHLLREPLLHFLVGGALLFVLYGMVADDPAYAPDRIVVDEARVMSLAGGFQRTWMRLPSSDELDELVREFINEEILYREALALGLDRDDSVIRRRMRQKMEFLHADLAEIEKPSEADLVAFLSANPERFAQQARVSFRQVYVNPDTGPRAPRDRANDILETLRAKGSEARVDDQGDPTLLPHAMEMASESAIAAAFGSEFAGDVLASADNGWTGPLASSFGLHLIRVDARTPARVPELGEIRRQVEREYETVQRSDADQQFLQMLRAQYEIEVRLPEAAPTLQSSTQGG